MRAPTSSIYTNLFLERSRGRFPRHPPTSRGSPFEGVPRDLDSNGLRRPGGHPTSPSRGLEISEHPVDFLGDLIQLLGDFPSHPFRRFGRVLRGPSRLFGHALREARRRPAEFVGRTLQLRNRFVDRPSPCRGPRTGRRHGESAGGASRGPRGNLLSALLAVHARPETGRRRAHFKSTLRPRENKPSLTRGPPLEVVGRVRSPAVLT